MENRTSLLYNKNNSIAFYEDRYHHSDIDEWPVEKKNKIIEVIRELPLPKEGCALDFGCGNGELTEVIRQALPAWSVYGTDLSPKAIDNAQSYFHECTFFGEEDSQLNRNKFDLVFTHHVLEHVYDLEKVFGQINDYLKPNAFMLHFLPCGNEGSYEYGLCLLRKDGFDHDLGGRFFFEDEGHVRRLTTKQMQGLFETRGFHLEEEYYSNQYYGAINWITSSSPGLILNLTNPYKAVDKESWFILWKERLMLLLVHGIRLPSVICSRMMRKKSRRPKHIAALLMFSPFVIFSYPIDRYMERLARREWNEKKRFRNGSEMGLFFSRPRKSS